MVMSTMELDGQPMPHIIKTMIRSYEQAYKVQHSRIGACNIEEKKLEPKNIAIDDSSYKLQYKDDKP